MIRTVIILMVMQLSVSLLSAQKVFTQEELEAVLHPALVEDAQKMLRFEQTEINAGVLSEDDKPQVYTFACTNVSSQKIVITRISTTCGCTDAHIDRPVINPGEKAVVSVTYNPFGQPGKIYTKAFVYADVSEKQPVASLSIVGQVTPSKALWKDYKYVMGDLKVRTKTVNFGVVSAGMHRVEKIACVNAGSHDLKISAMKEFLPDFIRMRTEPEVLEPGQEGYLVFELAGEKMAGNKIKKVFNVLLEGLSAPPSDRMIKISIETK